MSKISDLIFGGKAHYITSPFGKRNVISTSAGTTASQHNGTDYGTNGKKIAQYAIEEGKILSCGKAKDGALYVWVEYPRIGKKFLHYHLDSISVKTGQAVKKGTKLGTTGKTGKATGVHLHLGVKDLKTDLYEDPEKLVYIEPMAVVKSATPTTIFKVNDTVKISADAKYYGESRAVPEWVRKIAWKVSSVNGSRIVLGKSENGKYCIDSPVDAKFLTKVVSGVPAKAYYAKYTGKSTKIDDVLKAIGVPATYRNNWSKRKPVASANGISGYVGSAAQNMKLISLAKQGLLVKP